MMRCACGWSSVMGRDGAEEGTLPGAADASSMDHGTRNSDGGRSTSGEGRANAAPTAPTPERLCGTCPSVRSMADRTSDIIPVVPYEDIRAAHDFLVEVVGFTSGGVFETAE